MKRCVTVSCDGHFIYVMIREINLIYMISSNYPFFFSFFLGRHGKMSAEVENSTEETINSILFIIGHMKSSFSLKDTSILRLCSFSQ